MSDRPGMEKSTGAGNKSDRMARVTRRDNSASMDICEASDFQFRSFHRMLVDSI
jgi:hypothetical protein